MERKLGEISSRMDTVEREIKELKESNKIINSLNITLAKLDTTMETILKDINTLNKKVDKLEHQDSKKYNYMVKTITGAIITGIIGFLMGGLIK